MNLIADENVDKLIVDTLRQDGHDVLYVAEFAPNFSSHLTSVQFRLVNGILHDTLNITLIRCNVGKHLTQRRYCGNDV